MEITREHLVNWVNQLHGEVIADEVFYLSVVPDEVIVDQRDLETNTRNMHFIKVIG